MLLTYVFFIKIFFSLLPSSHFQFSGSDVDVEKLEKKFHFSLLRTLEKSRKRSKPLYSEMTFYVCPNVKYGANMITSLIKIGGGKVIGLCPTSSYSKKLVRIITSSDPITDSTRSSIIKSTVRVFEDTWIKSIIYLFVSAERKGSFY